MKRDRKNEEPYIEPYQDDYDVLVSKDCCPGMKLLKGLALLIGAAAGAAFATNTLIALRTPPPDDHLGGLFERYPGRLGDLAYTVSGDGPPLLLLHSLYPGASMAKWENNFAALAEQFTVYALDFLGWGASDKPEALYNADEYAEQIEFFIEDVIGAPCAIVASGQSGAFAIRAGARRSDLINNLVLICPPLPDQPEMPQQKAQQALDKLLQLPIIGTSLYNFRVSNRALDEWAKRHLFFNKNRVDETFIGSRHVATHQPGAHHATRAVWSGDAAHDAFLEWEQLTVPALLIWGRNALQPPVDTAPEWLALKTNAHLEVIEEAMLLPHAEHPVRFNQIVTDWLSRRP